jgi:hypothetical protein
VLSFFSLFVAVIGADGAGSQLPYEEKININKTLKINDILRQKTPKVLPIVCSKTLFLLR